MATSTWARRAMVSTSAPLAVQAGLWAMDQGGTAVDAAIAADAVLGVVQPMWTGIGGDAFCLVDDGGDVTAFNGSGGAPAALTLETCRASGLIEPPTPALGELMSTMRDDSPLAITVPGVVDAWAQLAERYGRLSLQRLLQPARTLAADGFPIGRLTARAWRYAAGRLHATDPFPAIVRAGERFANPALAASLDAIAVGGPEAHYQGLWAKQAVALIASSGGVLTEADLASHRGEWTAPIRGTYRDCEVIQHPPNGQGAAVLAALDQLDREPAGGPDDPTWLARELTAIRHGMRAAQARVADPRAGEVAEFWTGRDTVYTASVGGGLAVSLISSVFYQFGSGLVAGGAPLQNRGLGFSLDPGHPNVVAPGKRPFHTIIPALVHKNRRLWAVLGVVGGPMQPQGQVQVLSDLIDHGRDPQASLDSPRARWLGGNLVGLEAGLHPAAVPELADAGFEVLDQPLPAAELGAGQVIRSHDDGWLEGGADQRRDGVAFGR